MIQIAELINHFVNGIVDMATVKKIVKAQSGLCKPSSKRGGGVSCGSSRAPKSSEYKPGKMPRYSKKEQREMDAESERVVSGRKGKDIGVWHREWDSDESIPERLKSGYKKSMKKGGKIAEKAQVGKRLPKKAAVDSVDSEMFPGKKVAIKDIRRGPYITDSKGSVKKTKTGGVKMNKNGGKMKMASKKSKK
jgi:hypothetical protein